MVSIYYRKQIILYISEFLTSLSFTIMASFYPGVAESKGIPVWLIGFIFSIDPIIGIPTSIIVGKNMHRVGRKFFLTFGMIIGGLGMFMLGLVELSDTNNAIIFSIISRIFAGIGAGCAMVAAPSILISEYPGETDKVIGYFEASSGFGLMVGPLIGAVLNILGLFPSFTILAGIYALYSIFPCFLLGQLTNPPITTRYLSYIEFIRKPVSDIQKIFINFCAQMWLLFTLGYLSAVLELHLLSFGLSVTESSLFYSICTVTYFFSSLFENKLLKLTSQKVMISLGILLISISFFMIGPWEELLPRNLIVVGVGLGLLGMAGSIMYSKLYIVPTTSSIIDIATQSYGYQYNDLLLDSISSLTNLFCNIGEVFGPIVGGLLSSCFTFAEGFAIIGLCSMVLAFSYAIVFARCWKRSKKEFKTIPAMHFPTETVQRDSDDNGGELFSVKIMASTDE